MDRYVCRCAGYVYDPENGDAASGVEPETFFEDLPDGWICPECGVGKDDFEEEAP